MARINLNNVVVEFPIVNASSQSLQLRLFQSLGGKLTSHHKTVVVRALDGVDLALGMAIVLVLLATMDRARRPCFASWPGSICPYKAPRQSKVQYRRLPISRWGWIRNRPVGRTLSSDALLWE